MKKINKRGQNLALPVVIFIILNIIFFSVMFLFVQRVSSSALIYEEIYAKKIGLLLNRAEPGMQFQIDVTDLIEIALKNEVDPKEINKLIKIDSEKGIVIVKAKPEGGFNYPYFSIIEIDDTSDEATTRLNQIMDKNGKLTKGIFHITIL